MTRAKATKVEARKTKRVRRYDASFPDGLVGKLIEGREKCGH